ncbi:MAG: complex I NDUFA9 subunit family protein [Alphaproteobacteria bacterium]
MITTPISGTRLVTVFGGSGFLGRNLVRELAKDRWRIRVAVRRPNSADFLRPSGRVGQIQIVRCNVRSDDDVRAALAHADATVNLVGILAQSGKQRFMALHAEAAGRIARRCSELGVAHFVHISALGVSEDAASRYMQSKWEGESSVRMANPAAVIVRPSLMFGPDDNFFNRFAWLARLTPVLPLFGGGRTRFQPVFVGDVAQAIVRILDDPNTAGKIFEFGGPEVLTFKEIMQYVLTETKRKRLLVPLPFFIGRLQGAVLQFLPMKLLTLDQIRMLETDTVESGNHPGLKELGITPTAMEAIVPAYLWRFRKAGQFETPPAYK